MNRELIFRLSVDISLHPYEFFCYEGLYDEFNFFRHCALTFHIWVWFIKGSFHKMSMIINTIITITFNYKIIFTLSFNIFCGSNKILIKSFSNNLLISNFPTFNF